MSGEVPPAQPPPPPPPPPLTPDHHELVRPRPLWRWRRNALRRPTDRLQGWITLGLLLVVPTLAIAAMFGVGDTAYRYYRSTAEQQAQTRHHTTAVLVHDAPRHPEPGSAEAKQTRYPVTVRLVAPDGQIRTGETDVLPGLPAGSTVRVWADRHGTLTEPPLTTEEIRSRAMGWALITFMVVALAGAAANGAVALVLRRRNLAEWDADWADTAPRWTTSP
ncbi:Rv1733c family protein [Streptomyces poonensis]|uniref:Proline rich protein membrane protein n=1 Tax=Streptomyces poonensis TaxID=68255 RepID=A0A918PB11_9ACTN|nr:hypothetical protein [Streptomyces poonensis]GGY94799.1 hypothetical protein GCM10010365_11960 [Streptomyces poonensis]GLJ88727.1 hypothetical protein GCM10017589_13270 [Streptomyces poonensis]